MRNKFDVFFYEAFEEEALLLKYYSKNQFKAGFTFKTIQEYGKSQPPASVISIRTQSVIPDCWADKISGILTRSTGYDHIERYLKKCNKNVLCGYLPLYCSRSVAEQAMLLWMSLLRKLPQQLNNFNTFNRNGLTGHECKGKTLLVVGVGNIGIEIVKIGNALGMNVLGVDIKKKHPSVSYVNLDYGLSKADIIVCAMNLTNENIYYFNYQTLKKAKKGSIFINISRGELSRSSDLLRLLDEKHIAGIALDVYNKESLLAHSLRERISISDKEIQSAIQLSKLPNVIMTPHNAFNTQEAVDRKASQSIEQVKNFIKYKRFIWPVEV